MVSIVISQNIRIDQMGLQTSNKKGNKLIEVHHFQMEVTIKTGKMGDSIASSFKITDMGGQFLPTTQIHYTRITDIDTEGLIAHATAHNLDIMIILVGGNDVDNNTVRISDLLKSFADLIIGLNHNNIKTYIFPILPRNFFFRPKQEKHT